MVKGVTKQAVILKSPDMKTFEQAIFIISADNEDAIIKSPEEMLSIANNIAAKYTVKTLVGKKKFRWPTYALCFAAGSGLTALALWYFSVFPL